jgi:hypothetical protein
MALYSATWSIAGVNATDQVLFCLVAAASDRVFVREVGMFLEVLPTTAPQYSLKRMNANGTGGTTNATVGLHDPADGAVSAALGTAWVTLRPTVTGGAFRRTSVPLALGNGVIFDFTSRPIVVPVSGGLCGVILNASGATVGTHGGYVVWEE